VGGDAIRAAQFSEHSSGDRVRFRGAASLADGGDMVDVDAEGGQGSGLQQWMFDIY
jgi:hypothetical protein